MNLGKKILVVGANGSGKTTFAKHLSSKLSIPFYELDSISWLEDWKIMPREEFTVKVKEILQSENWIIDGNYKNTLVLRLQNADCVIWLDYRISKVLYRVIKRTLKALITRKRLWKNNRQSFKTAFHPKVSIIFLAIQTYKSKSNLLEEKMMSKEFCTLNWIRIKNRKEEYLFWKSIGTGIQKL